MTLSPSPPPPPRPDDAASAVDRYLDGALDAAERGALLARLRADPAARSAFVAGLRLATALAATGDDSAAVRGERAALVMATLSDSRRTAALRRVETAIGLAPQAVPPLRRWRPWLLAATAALVLVAVAAGWRLGRGGTAGAPAPARTPATTEGAEIAAGAGATAPVEVNGQPTPAPAPEGPTSLPEVAPDLPVATQEAPPPPPTAQEEAPPQPLVALAPSSPTAPARPHPDLQVTRRPGSDGGAPVRPPGAESWVAGRGTIHRQGRQLPTWGGSAALAIGDVVDSAEEAGCEIHLGTGQTIACAPRTRVELLPPRPKIAGRLVALPWGGVTATLAEDGARLTVVTAHGEVRGEQGVTSLRAYPEWVRVAVTEGHARVGLGADGKTLEEGHYALLVHGHPLVAPLARAASEVVAGALCVQGEALLPGILRLPAAPAPAARAERLRALGEAGFSAVAVGAADIDAGLLADAQEAGLGVVGELAAVPAGGAALARGRAHGALLAWWMAGAPREPVRIASAVRQLDAQHVLAASFSGEQQRGAPPACDLLVLDPTADGRPESMAARWAAPATLAALRVKCVFAALPLLPGARAAEAGPDLPARQRCLAWLALAHGARGLIWQAGAAPVGDDAANAMDAAIASAAALSGAIARHAVMIATGARQRLETGSPDLAGMRWDGAGGSLVALVNAGGQAQALAIRLPGPRLAALRPLDGEDAGDLHLVGDRLTGTLPPAGVAVLVAAPVAAP